MGNSKAIVTLTIGGGHLDMWKRLCQANWRKYADKHGYDLICIDAPLDESERARRRSPAWQKCLILGQDFSARYERIVWLDADIIINCATAPCIASDVPLEKVGAVDAWATPTPELAQIALERLYEYWGEACMIRDYTAREYYAHYGLPPRFDEVVQTGVMVLSPAHHRHLLEKAYFDYEEMRKDDMRYISYELLEAGSVHWIDNRFNAIWLVQKALHYPFLLNRVPTKKALSARLKQKFGAKLGEQPLNETVRQCVAASFRNNFFLHFAGCLNEMELLASAA